MSIPVLLAAVTVVFFLCNLVYWMNPATREGKFAAGLWWFTALLFLLSYPVKPAWLLAIPFLITWGLDLWIQRSTPVWAEKLRKGTQHHGIK
ncbi:hypothetical protein A6M27_13770 [Acidithiobacillus thiooxidans]|uniref:DUF4491 domain-containing protein n=1 Tax=Acidithiobacillus thiooxidans TaxID=930 RepID=A0A1C2JD11_ACITH|nr:hypothetical protein [Acidithiobacillus thiooxidans]OCX69076.1 hypothetical protein A6P07_17260 [Acidithiobacillus thiooxidans]OCX83833.1 hypothetical protein A6O26_06275 [Acidithiobacillus thiooxidans]OCX86122.1 hypothetical protein A6M27_13770 [Acidithiobacillus thiooxidans]OFC50238.1 hypothetical protein BAE47_02770 [Acidithiobacillus thiooxidans]